MRAAAFLKRLKLARARTMALMTGAHDGSFYARGLSSEGWLGGYLQALDDVDAMLRHGYPNDPRQLWTPDKASPAPPDAG